MRFWFFTSAHEMKKMSQFNLGGCLFWFNNFFNLLNLRLFLGHLWSLLDIVLDSSLQRLFGFFGGNFSLLAIAIFGDLCCLASRLNSWSSFGLYDRLNGCCLWLFDSCCWCCFGLFACNDWCIVCLDDLLGLLDDWNFAAGGELECEQN